MIGLSVAGGLARADDWPTKPVTLIVPFAPGGTTDIVGRIIAQQLSVRLGQTVVVENIGGAGGTLGATNASRAAPDGYTIFMATVAHTMAPGIYKKLAYNFEQDFEPVTVVATVPNILIVNPAVPAKNVTEFIAYLKANPGKVSYGSAGVGSTEHMSAELFRSIAGVDIVHVPYRGGSPMLADLVAGNIQMSIETSGAATPSVQAGSVRALAVSPAKRSPLFPDLPTLAESGPQGLRRVDVVRLSGAERHAGRHSRQALHRDRRDPERSRHRQAARRLRRRTRRRTAGAIRSFHP